MPEVSRHHGLWERRDYLDHEWYREARSTLIVPMRHIGHMGLHKAVEPPTPPSTLLQQTFINIERIVDKTI